MELVFKNCRIINFDNFSEQSEIHQQQMAICATNGFGEEFQTAEDFLAQTGDGEMEEGYAELWDIIDEANPTQVIYECWVYLADTANIFLPGTAIDTRLVMIQWDFENYSGNEELNSVVESLQIAFKNKIID